MPNLDIDTKKQINLFKNIDLWLIFTILSKNAVTIQTTGCYRIQKGSGSLCAKRRQKGQTKGILPQEASQEQEGTQRTQAHTQTEIQANAAGQW